MQRQGPDVEVDFGHGFIPRIDKSNYRALERVLQPRSLFDVADVGLAWVILDGAWAPSNTEVLSVLKREGVRYLIDTTAWRFQHGSAFEIAKYRSLPHAPDRPWEELTAEDFGRFVTADLRFQAELGADAYFVPGLVPLDDDERLLAWDRAAATAAESVCFERPQPAVTTLGVHTQGLDFARSRLGALSGLYSGIYVLGTPVRPYRDGVAKMANLTQFFVDAQAGGRQVIAGRMGAITVPLRALGISAADAGLGTGESFRLQEKLRSPMERDPADESDRSGGPGSSAGSRYLRPIKRSVAGGTAKVIDAVAAASALLRCETCCRYYTPDDRVRRGREHSLITRLTEATEISGLPPSMRLERAEREWEGARRQLTAVNRALTDAGEPAISPEYLDNQLTVLRSAAKAGRAA